MTEIIRGPFVMGDKFKLKISGNLEAAEALRQQRVPHYYTRCPYRKVTARPYDHLTEETPVFVECGQTVFGKQHYTECLGQCAVAGQQYGKKGEGK